MIIAGVGCFCIPVSFPWRLFDLSLITFKHHKAFDCFPLIYLSYSKPSSIKLPSVSRPHVCPRLASFPLYVCIFLYVSCSCDSKKSRPHTFVYIIAVFASFFFLFFIQVISAKAQWGIETNRKKYIKRRQNVPTDWECLTAMEKGKCRDADSFWTCIRQHQSLQLQLRCWRWTIKMYCHNVLNNTGTCSYTFLIKNKSS